MSLLIIVLMAMLTENFVLSKFLGICPFLGVSKRMGTAAGMAMAVLFVMLVASVITYVLQTYVLVPFQVTYLQTIAFILVIASTVQLTEMAVQKLSPSLYQALVIFHAVGAAGGFAIALLLFAGLREKLEGASVPRAFKGAAIAFITAGILSLAFMGFSGLAPSN